MILAVISDSVWQSLIAALLSITLTWMGMKLKLIEKTGEKTHTLVNSNMGVQLTISETALRRVAELTNHPTDIMAWEKAKKALEEHEIKQSIVDKREAKS